MLINEAVDAVHARRVAADIELAMTKGVNYPKGLLAWGDEIGLPAISPARALQAEYGEDRYRRARCCDGASAMDGPPLRDQWRARRRAMLSANGAGSGSESARACAARYGARARW